ncbi:Nuclear RNA export factor 1, partial [Eumeta japonica]
IQSGQRYSKDDVIRAILCAISPDIFIPHYWRTEKNCVVFFVDDYSIAQRLQNIERSVQMPLMATVCLYGCVPVVPLFQWMRNLKKNETGHGQRYNPQTKALDLTKFHADADFRNIFVGLFRTPVMSAALDIIQANIPDLEALNLNENNIASMESFKNVEQRLPT